MDAMSGHDTPFRRTGALESSNDSARDGVRTSSSAVTRQPSDASTSSMTKQEGFDPEEYFESFSALRSSMSQGRDLKKKRKALDEYRKTLETLKASYADRVHIARDYDEVVREQEIIIKSTLEELKVAERKRDDIMGKISDANDALADLKRRQERERRPFEEELDRRNAELASAKDELRQVKAQRDSLDLFDDESAQVQASEVAHEHIVDRVNDKLEAAKSAQRAAQKALDAREKEERSKVKKAQDTIKGLNGDKEKADKRIEELEKKIAASHDRIAFCAYVIEHPEETASMLDRIEENERTAAQMDAQIESLAASHARSKAASGKAKIVVALVVIVLALFIAFFIFVSRP